MAAKLNANNNRYHSLIIRNILISLMVNTFDEIRALKDPTVQRKSHLVKIFDWDYWYQLCWEYFTRSLCSLVKYFSTLAEKFRISASPCNILYLLLNDICCSLQFFAAIASKPNKLKAKCTSINDRAASNACLGIFSGTDLAFCHQ